MMFRYKLATCILIFGMVCNQMLGQFSEPHYLSDNAHSIVHLEVVDFDGDGLNDILYSGSDYSNPLESNNFLAWYRNSDGVNFERKERLLEMSAVRQFDVLQFDLDPAMELVYQDNENNLIVADIVYGMLLNPVVIGTPEFYYFQHTILDISGDGDMDIVYKDSENVVLVIENLGDNQFQTFEIFQALGYAINEITSADVNGDGFVDLLLNDALGAEGSQLRLMLNSPTGLSDPLDIGPVIQISKTEIFDLDNDGDLDVLVAYSTEFGPVDFHALGQTNGVWDDDYTFYQTLSDGTTNWSWFDYDLDGDYDCFSSGSASLSQPYQGQISLVENDNGSLIELFTEPYFGYSLRNIEHVDMDNDGEADIVFDSAIGQKIGILDLSNDSFNVRDVANPMLNCVFDADQDLDNDGDNDLTAAGLSGEWLTFKFEDGEFVEDQSLMSDTGSVYKRTMRALDYDSDGDIDILAPVHDGISSQGLMVAVNVDGQFEPEVLVSNNFAQSEVIAENLNGDEWLDFISVTGNWDNNSINAYISNGSSWVNNTNFISFGNYGSTSFGAIQSDVNGDGFMDLILFLEEAEDAVSRAIAVALFDGVEYSIGPPLVTGLTGSGSQFLIYRDYDLDGIKDIIYFYEKYEDPVYVLLGNEDGFSAENEIVTTVHSDLFLYNLMHEDLDDDGDADLISSYFGTLHFFRNDLGVYSEVGSAFYPTGIISRFGSSGHDRIPAIDINGDGKTDIVGRGETGDLFWSINQGLLVNTAPPLATGRVFYDTNENGIFEEDEAVISSVPVTVTKPNGSIVTMPGGTFYFDPTPGIHTVTAWYNNVLWQTTNSNQTYELQVSESLELSLANLDIGLKEQEPIWDAMVDIVSSIGLCLNEQESAVIVIQNTGNQTIEPGILALQTDDLIDITGAVFPLDSLVEEIGYYTIDSLIPGEIMYFNFEYDYLGSDPFEDVSVFNYSYSFLGENDVLSFEDGTSINFLCSFDPNDKSVEPTGSGFAGEIPPTTENLEYTIRFQNTGTAAAADVTILDQLSSNLNWQSLDVILASHDYSYNISDEGLITFSFNDIFLPDSGSSIIESQGFIKYRIDLNDALLVGTIIENSAEIFFDFNTGIVTNTVINTIQACLGWSTQMELTFDGSLIEIINSPDSAMSFEWYLDGMLIEVTAEPFFLPAASGSYFVVASNDENCSSVSAEVDVVIDNITIVNQPSITAFPNPTNDILNIILSHNHNGAQLRIIDMQGKTVLTKRVDGNNAQFPINNIERGMYVLQCVFSDNSVRFMKIVRE